jgi:hypothetical protein
MLSAFKGLSVRSSCNSHPSDWQKKVLLQESVTEIILHAYQAAS